MHYNDFIKKTTPKDDLNEINLGYKQVKTHETETIQTDINIDDDDNISNIS